MNFDLKKLIYTVITILCVFFAVHFFIKILPFLLICGVMVYLFIKVKGMIALKKAKQQENLYTDDFSNSNTENNNNYSFNNSSDEYYSEDNDFSGQIIDVDYEDSDEKK